MFSVAVVAVTIVQDDVIHLFFVYSFAVAVVVAVDSRAWASAERFTRIWKMDVCRKKNAEREREDNANREDVSDIAITVIRRIR